MNSPVNNVMVSAMSKALAKTAGDIKEPPRSFTARAIMLLKPALMKAGANNTAVMAMASNLVLIAAIADSSPEFQAEFEKWIQQVNKLAK
jgi:hypothetical protein